MTMNVQLIMQNNLPAFAVIPYADYQRLIKQSEDKHHNDNLTIPNEVVNMFFNEKCSLIKAWRVYLGKTQKEIAAFLGIGQSACAQIEKSRRCQKATLEKVAVALGIEPGQLTLED